MHSPDQYPEHQYASPLHDAALRKKNRFDHCCERCPNDRLGEDAIDESTQLPTNIESRKVLKNPWSWEQVLEIVATNQFHLLSRSAANAERYAAHRDRLKKESISVSEYILCSKFNVGAKRARGSSWTESTDSPYKIDVPYPVAPFSVPKAMQCVQTSLCRNDFPYYVEHKIEHWCLWKLGGSVTDDDIAEAKGWLLREVLQSDMGTIRDMVHFVNPPQYQSVPDIDHAHILCLRGEAA